MSKKTIHVNELIELVNKRNSLSTCNVDIRIGWNCLLEFVLHDTNTYAGFVYIQEVPEGQTPGLIDTGSTVTGDKYRIGDDSRRHYLIHKSLRPKEN